MASTPHSFVQDQDNHALRPFVLCALLMSFVFKIAINMAEAGLSCGMGDLAPGKGLNPGPLHWEQS